MMLMPLSPPLSWAREGCRAAVRRVATAARPDRAAGGPGDPSAGAGVGAQSPKPPNNSFSLDKILPSSMMDKPFLVKVITVLIMMAIAGGVVMIGFGVMGGVADVFTAVSDARRHGEWGLFIKNVAFIVAVLVVAAVLIALVMEWMNNLTINPTITIGGERLSMKPDQTLDQLDRRNRWCISAAPGPKSKPASVAGPPRAPVAGPDRVAAVAGSGAIGFSRGLVGWWALAYALFARHIHRHRAGKPLYFERHRKTARRPPFIQPGRRYQCQRAASPRHPARRAPAREGGPPCPTPRPTLRPAPATAAIPQPHHRPADPDLTRRCSGSAGCGCRRC